MRIFLDTDINLKYFWKIKRDTYKRGYSVEQVLEKIRVRENDHQQYIIPQKENSDLQIRFFTDKDFNYKHFDKEPNIYLSMTVSKELKSFLNVLDNNDLNYTFSKQKETSTITFYKTQNFRPCVYELLKNQQINNLESNDYYTIIIALVIYLHQ